MNISDSGTNRKQKNGRVERSCGREFFATCCRCLVDPCAATGSLISDAVIPAAAGIQKLGPKGLDSRLRGNDNSNKALVSFTAQFSLRWTSARGYELLLRATI